MKAVIAGSFDPLTNGHADIIRRAARLFDEVVVACGNNIAKRYFLPLDQRLELIRVCTTQHDNVSVDSFNGLLVGYCQRVGAEVIVRGLRGTSDFDFEFQIGLANMDMAPEIESVFLLTEPNNLFISSSLVKEIAKHGGDVSGYLPAPVHEALMAKL
jgi:pantetheine-phosphate adenylyltransferase